MAKPKDVEMDVIAILCELTDALGWSEKNDKDKKKLAAFKEAVSKLTTLLEA